MLNNILKPTRWSVFSQLFQHFNLISFIIVASTILLDYATKLFVHQLIPLHNSVNLIPGFLNITHVRNTGAAFGFLNAVDFPFKTSIMIGVALLALVVLTLYAYNTKPQGTFARIGFALIVGGAIGNLIDRASTGYVTDFIDVFWGTYHFWAFNIADATITIGAILLLLDTIESE